MTKKKENENKNMMEQRENSYRQYDTFFICSHKNGTKMLENNTHTSINL